MLTFFTSGSTGDSKLIRYQYSAIDKLADKAIGLYKYDSSSRILNLYPNSSIAHYTISAYPAQKVKAELLNFYWNVYGFYNVFKKFEPTHIACLPKHILLLSKTKAWKEINFSGCTIIIGGDKIEKEILKMLIDKNAKVITTYGSTENAPPVLIGKNSLWMKPVEKNISIHNSELHVNNKPTGDLFKVSEDNYYKFLSRKDKIINKTWKR